MGGTFPKLGQHGPFMGRNYRKGEWYSTSMRLCRAEQGMRQCVPVQTGQIGSIPATAAVPAATAEHKDEQKNDNERGDIHNQAPLLIPPLITRAPRLCSQCK